MYQFADTTTTGNVTTELPAEAMQFNGEYLEDVIDGYRTLYVRGRESMLAEINAYETGVRDGTGITSKRFPARELAIGYLLKADTNEAFREAYNALNGILNTQDAQIIFHDEEDKYFTGTPEGLDEIEAGRNFVQGEIIIYCADPFKYSVEEVKETISRTTTLDYKGTYKTRPRLEADFKSDCGYIWWRKEETGAIIQVGDATESEGEYYEKSQILLTQNFLTNQDLSSWEQNPSDVFWIGSEDLYYPYAIRCGGNFSFSSGYLGPGEFLDNEAGQWSGMCMVQDIPADSNGDFGSRNWRTAWTQIINASEGDGYSDPRGAIQVILLDESNNVIAGVSTSRSRLAGAASPTGCFYYCTKNNSGRASGYDFSTGNSMFGSGGYCTVTKSGSTVTFDMAGATFSLTDSGISNTLATRVMIVFLHLGETAVMEEEITAINFQKHNITDWRDLENSFANGDTVIADCRDGMIYLNNAETPSYGLVDNNWESFYFDPGSNTVRFSYSAWVSEKPELTICYREVFI